MSRDVEKTARAILDLEADQARNRFDGFEMSERVKMILALPAGKERLDLIFASANPTMLVRALPPEDFILTIKAIGMNESLELLEMSSDEQTTYLADLEMWMRDGVDMGRMAYWNQLMSRCSRKRMLRWVHALDFELLVLMFERTVVSIDKEAIDDLPEKLSQRWITSDGYHFLVVKLGADYDLVKNFVDFIYTENQAMFLALMGNLGTNPPAEVEEITLRWRNGRLADRGWPEPEDAASLYQPRDPEKIRTTSDLPVGLDNPPRYPLEKRFSGTLLNGAIERAEDPSILASQLANLINRVVIADGLLASEPESLEEAGRRVKGRIEIGLSNLGARDAESAARLATTVPLLHIFQVAQHAIVQRSRRAREIVSADAGQLSALLAPPLDEILAHTISRRPHFVPGKGVLPRDFESVDDLGEVDRQLDRIEAAFVTAGALGLDSRKLPQPFPAGSHPASVEALSLDDWVLTAFARQRLGLKEFHTPLPFGSLATLFGSLPGGEPSLKETLHLWITTSLSDPPPGLDAYVTVLARLLVDLLRHDPEAIDPRFVEGLWIQAGGDR
jgi:hypothetical protein